MKPPTQYCETQLKPLTHSQLVVLRRAAARPAPHFVCPIKLGVAPETTMLRSLVRRGLITDTMSPTLTPAGLAAAGEGRGT
jgi:hypothetical protein